MNKVQDFGDYEDWTLGIARVELVNGELIRNTSLFRLGLFYGPKYSSVSRVKCRLLPKPP